MLNAYRVIPPFAPRCVCLFASLFHPGIAHWGACRTLRRVVRVPYRPLPGQGNDAKPARPALFQHHVRAHLEPRFDPERDVHFQGELWDGGAGRLLRQVSQLGDFCLSMVFEDFLDGNTPSTASYAKRCTLLFQRLLLSNRVCVCVLSYFAGDVVQVRDHPRRHPEPPHAGSQVGIHKTIPLGGFPSALYWLFRATSVRALALAGRFGRP